MIVALAPGPSSSDAREAIALGPHGEAYEPDGKGAWVRRHGGGLSGEVVRASRAGALVIAGVEAGPPFGYRAGAVGGAWNLIVLGLHAKAIVGRGPRATAAFGKQVFGLESGKPVRLADAPGVVSALGASPHAIAIETDQGLARLEAGTRRWKPIAKAPAHVIALLDDRWALVDRGLLDLTKRAVTPWPAGFRVATAIAVTSDLVVAAGLHGNAPELVTLARSRLSREAIAPSGGLPGRAGGTGTADFGTGAAAIISVVADTAGRVVVAAQDGQLAVRDKAGTWTFGRVRSELPADRPGPPPAASKSESRP
ncbi:MAG: hypothetical protein ABI467_25995 [Kofleriaceae bacterium]